MQEFKNILASPTNVERLILAGIGLLQGVTAWLVVRIEPQEPIEKSFLFGLLAWVLSSGLLYQFASSGRERMRLTTVVTSLGLPFSVFTFYVVLQLPPKGSTYEGDDFRLITWSIAATLALYIILPYLQIFQRKGRPIFPYPDLYRHSWNNFFLGGLAWFYTGVYWMLVWLFAALFQALGIHVIQRVISKPSFIFITTWIMAGVGVALAKEHAQIISTLRAISSTLCRSLTPLLVVIALSFVATLPFTGLAPLWATKWASSILLSLLLSILLFVNAVFQDGEGTAPYGPFLRRGVEATLMAMPILVGLTLYSMNLRILQYGFTPERYYAIVFAIVLGGYSVGYAWSVVRAGSVWLGNIRRFNVALSVVVLGLALALHSPLMDPLKRSAEDQERRFLNGAVDVKHFDFGSMRFELGHHGQAVLDRLALLKDHPAREQITAQLARLQKVQHKWKWKTPAPPPATPEAILAKLTVYPPGHTIPADLLPALNEQSHRHLFDSCSTDHPCDILAGQWDDDAEVEYVVLNGCGYAVNGCQNYTVALFNRFGSTSWKEVASISLSGDPPMLSRDETLLGAKQGRLKFSGVQYHCMTGVATSQVCDYWDKVND